MRVFKLCLAVVPILAGVNIGIYGLAICGGCCGAKGSPNAGKYLSGGVALMAIGLVCLAQQTYHLARHLMSKS